MEIDNYGISTFKTCPKQFDYRINKHLVSQKVNLPANFGIAIHDGLDAFYKTSQADEAIKMFGQAWKPFEGMDSRGLYTAVRGAAILLEYIEGYDNLEPVHVEVGIACHVDNTSHILTGRVDMVARWDGQIYVVDHKTRSKSLQTFCIQPNYQLLGYSYGVRETLGMEQFPPLMANLIKVAKKYDELCLRMTHDILEHEMEEWADDFIYWCARIEDCKTFNKWPRIGQEYVCAWCEYQEVCNQPEMEERFIENGIYTVKAWKPY